MAIIMLAGPIKHWWDDKWGTPAHTAYLQWRTAANDALVANGYLVYRPHEAFKGNWDERAQSVNDMVLRSADLILNLTPPGVPSLGTDAEMHYAANFDAVIVSAPPAEDYEAAVKALLKKVHDLTSERTAVDQEPVIATLVVKPGTEWMLPGFLHHHKNSQLRLHYYDEAGHVQTVDAQMIVPARTAETPHAVVKPVSGDKMSVAHQQMLKIEVLDR